MPPCWPRGPRAGPLRALWDPCCMRVPGAVKGLRLYRRTRSRRGRAHGTQAAYGRGLTFMGPTAQGGRVTGHLWDPGALYAGLETPWNPSGFTNSGAPGAEPPASVYGTRTTGPRRRARLPHAGGGPPRPAAGRAGVGPPAGRLARASRRHGPPLGQDGPGMAWPVSLGTHSRAHGGLPWPRPTGGH